MSGFANAERVSAFYADTYYPLGQTECCTPAVLLSTGDVWELTRWVGHVCLDVSGSLCCAPVQYA